MPIKKFNLGYSILDFLGKMVWSEDDALPVDRERLDQAIPRITGMSGNLAGRADLAEMFVDGGDCDWEIYPDWVICRSFPGQTAIYERKK